MIVVARFFIVPRIGINGGHFSLSFAKPRPLQRYVRYHVLLSQSSPTYLLHTATKKRSLVSRHHRHKSLVLSSENWPHETVCSAQFSQRALMPPRKIIRGSDRRLSLLSVFININIFSRYEVVSPLDLAIAPHPTLIWFLYLER
jgi:hypothetical protein